MEIWNVIAYGASAAAIIAPFLVLYLFFREESKRRKPKP
jgi:hypothetical protein